MGTEYTGVLGLIILALDIWAIITVFRSDATTSGKLLWSLLIVILPVSV